MTSNLAMCITDNGAPESFLAFRLSLLASHLTRFMARACRSFGLSATGWRVLALIGQAGRLSRQDILAKCGIDKVRLSRIAGELRAEGYIKQVGVDGDKRQAALELTPHGREICREVRQLMLELQTSFFGKIAGEDYNVFARVLNTFETQIKASGDVPTRTLFH